jgi:serine/threonine protein kinase
VAPVTNILDHFYRDSLSFSRVAADMPRLVVLEGKKPGAQVDLGDRSISVGRLASCELPIDEPQASRKHFELQKRSGAFWVRDLGSKNGTYLNDSRLDGEAALKDGDRLRVGTTVMAYEAAPPPVPSGTRLGPYELGGVHERREGLTIHDAHHASLGRSVHVELLEEGDKSAPAFLARARAASSYDHPVLLAVFDAGEHEGRAYRICEAWPDGRALEERLREGKLSEALALKVATQIAQGLAHLHAKEAVHGWLTPKVIRVDDAGATKVEVVGGDKLIRLDPLRADARLQALSISPEEARGLDPTAKSDVYALGCILFRALAGVAPFDGELAQVIRAHAGEQAAPRLATRDQDLAGELDELVARLLAKKADARPTAEDAATELAELAEQAEDAKPVKTRPSGGTWGTIGGQKAAEPAKPVQSRVEGPATGRAEPPAPPPKRKSGDSAARPAPRVEAPRAEAPAPPPPPTKESKRDTESGDDTDEVERELVPYKAFDPIRAALLGAVFFLLFFLSSQGTIVVLRVLGK